SAVINNTLNWSIGKAFRRNPDGKMAYAVRSYVSTFVGQFMDNFIFSILVFTVFAPVFWDGFCWTVLQCMMCALTGAVAELIMEVLFSPVGYRIVCKWRSENVGRAYLDYMEKGSRT
ncbi:MAG: VUT family protein, partial [Clostridia bacterium]|nr:VUT family protein [Clostridia bacterium]